MSSPHHTTVELANCKLSLREDLAFHLQEYGGVQCYLIEDELNSRFYRVGLSEYHLISLLDGRTPLSKAVAMSSAAKGKNAVGEMEAVTICKWLIDSGLATTDASRRSERLLETYEEKNRKQNLAKLNPITPKFSLFNPDAFLSKANDYLGWLFSAQLVAVWICVVLTGVYQVWANWDSLGGSQNMVFAPENWLWLAVTWIVLKLVHEAAHGIVCKRFDGEVRQAGIVMIVMIPLPYVDVSSSWRFRSKWQRIYVAGAGMYAEIFLAAVAAVVWCNADVGVVKQQAFNVMLAGSLTTLLFNANPLMRFDGYYMLIDWLEAPNLGTHGQQFLKWLGKKYYLGLEVKKPTWPEGGSGLIAGYAFAALIWKVLICVGLAIAAESLFFGAGLILAAAAVCMWVAWPIIKLFKFVFVGEGTQQQPGRIRFCITTSLLALVLVAAYQFVPWNARIKAPAIVDFATNTEIRMPVGGFLREIFVANDQSVVAGQLLAKLENRDLAADVSKMKIESQESQLRIRQLRQNEELAAYEVELKNLEALHKRLIERSEQLKGLEVRATTDGIIVADDLNVLKGTYLSAGHKFCSIGSGSRKEIHALVSQRDFEQFQNRSGGAVDVLVWGQGQSYFPAVLSQVNPRARVELPHPAFSSVVGGPLPVKYSSLASKESQNQDDGFQSEKSQFELIRPHFLARVELNEADSKRLHAGQPAMVSFRATRGSVGDVISEWISNWLRKLRGNQG